MSTIQFKEVNCKNCYKCVRSCPVKAISLKNDHAQVIEEECVFCGKCLQVCPQNAKSVKNDVEKVKGFADKKLKIYASIAPSFMAAFNLQDLRQAYSVFKKLGFTYIEETAVGASAVSAEYQKLLEKKQMKNIITTACPTIVSLIEKHYPELIEQMAPVVSPMVAHGKMLKELYGSRIKVVFIGPCLSKKQECKELEEDVLDAVITFEELEQWMKDENLSFDSTEEAELKNIEFNFNARYYPTPGGIIKSLGSPKKHNYKLMKFDGLDRCIEVLEQLRNDKVKDYFIEMNSCRGACLGGTCMNSENPGYLIMRERLLEYAHKSSLSHNTIMEYDREISLTKAFKNKSNSYIVPEDKIIEDILSKIGKYTKEQELNCGACGYMTCRDKAVAVYNKKAELHMCVPYMRERAESISNVIINSTPNAIFAVTEELTVQEANMAARRLFNLECEELQNRSIFDILDCLDILTVNDTKQNILNSKYTYLKYNVVVEQSILYLKENHMLMIVMKDITKDEKQNQKLNKVRSETIEIAQKVIDKQMRVAQEIASLLGETTAETKVALTKLKKSMQVEMGEEI
ncbi:4Fe-4S binding protein [Clostridium sp. YIM B02515]|uniref:4Fe-4S binding protein n=1 Tax=Clostridium rhizosphaerae TaxID=2803861 RepID=A0ABS1TC27_9CLOT|nr:[Fe-Fe] hydrogenase large subunit C-terminal domain-containing protein [Clostridium rhizosphaerae]MBL4936186.1 4Fe-4S binding protein [Clostridium rhizosphaerae]